MVLLYTVLQARFDIREYFLNTVVKEIYENIGQVLTLVHMQLSLLNDSNNQTVTDASAPKRLITQSIRDLRFICTQLFSDLTIVDNKKWIEGLEYTIVTLNLNNRRGIKIKGEQKYQSAELQVLLFRIIQEILFAIKKEQYAYHVMSIHYSDSWIVVGILYSGGSIIFDNMHMGDKSFIKFSDRLELMNGKLQTQKLKSGKSLIKLEAPINLPVYG